MIGVGDYITFDAQVTVGPGPSGEPHLSMAVDAAVLQPCSTARFGTPPPQPPPNTSSCAVLDALCLLPSGFIVLHPLLNLVGEPVDVVRADGSADPCVFPVEIPPNQVFTDIAGLSHAVTPGSETRAVFAFHGADLYEMEDQRQW